MYLFHKVTFTKSFLLVCISQIQLLRNRSVFGNIYMAPPSMSICAVLFALYNAVHKHNYSTQYTSIRASTVGVVNVPKAKFLAQLPHQTQKTSNIRCAKFYNFYNMYTVPLQICNGTESKWYNFNHFLFSFLSPLSSLFTLSFSLLSHLYSFSLFPSLLSHPDSLCSLFSL